MKLIAGAELHIVSKVIDDKGDKYTLNDKNGGTIRYNELFEKRQGLTFNIGLHIEF